MTKEQDDRTARLPDEVFGPPHAPERGLVARQKKTEDRLDPIEDLYKAFKGPFILVMTVAATAGITVAVNYFLGGK